MLASSSTMSYNTNPTSTDRRARREIANSNERRRMQNINAGFEALRGLLPDSDRLSKAAILHTASDFIQLLLDQQAAMSRELEQLKQQLSSSSSSSSCYLTTQHPMSAAVSMKDRSEPQTPATPDHLMQIATASRICAPNAVINGAPVKKQRNIPSLRPTRLPIDCDSQSESASPSMSPGAGCKRSSSLVNNNAFSPLEDQSRSQSPSPSNVSLSSLSSSSPPPPMSATSLRRATSALSSSASSSLVTAAVSTRSSRKPSSRSMSVSPTSAATMMLSTMSPIISSSCGFSPLMAASPSSAVFGPSMFARPSAQFSASTSSSSLQTTSVMSSPGSPSMVKQNLDVIFEAIAAVEMQEQQKQQQQHSQQTQQEGKDYDDAMEDEDDESSAKRCNSQQRKRNDEEEDEDDEDNYNDDEDEEDDVDAVACNNKLRASRLSCGSDSGIVCNGLVQQPASNCRS